MIECLEQVAVPWNWRQVPLEKLEAQRWQHDVWYRIIEAALAGEDRNPLSGHPGLDQLASTQYAAVTPGLLLWVRKWNRGKPYRRQMRPYGILLALWAHVPDGRWSPMPVTPYDPDITKAVQNCFDRQTGKPIGRDQIMTYLDFQTLSQYHLHPEIKFRNGQPFDRGKTQRRHVVVSRIEHIGKEADRLDEQEHLGVDLEAELEYGMSPDVVGAELEEFRNRCRPFPIRALAMESGLSHPVVSRIAGNCRSRSCTASEIEEGCCKPRGCTEPRRL